VRVLDHLSRLAVVLLVLVSAPQQARAEASARHLMDSLSLVREPTVTKVGVGIADVANNSVYPIRKAVPKAKVVSMVKRVGGAGIMNPWLLLAIAAATIYLDDGVPTVHAYHFNWSSSTCSPTTLSNATEAAALAWWEACAETKYSTGSWSGYSMEEFNVTVSGTDAYGNRNFTASAHIKNPSGGWYGWVNPGGLSRTAGTYVSDDPRAATDDEIYDAVESYGSPYASDIFQQPDGTIAEEVMESPTEPEPLTETQRQQLQDDLVAGCDSGGDAVVYELCLLGRRNGVTGAPDPVEVPVDNPANGGEEEPAEEPTPIEFPSGETSGGDTCASPPTCTHDDPVQCAMVEQQWRSRCVDADLAAVYAEVDATEAEIDGDIGAGELTMGGLDSDGGFTAGSCPDATVINVMGQSISLNIWERACQMATTFAPFVMVMGYMLALGIVVNGVKR
jgi:hypothetical protein